MLEGNTLMNLICEIHKQAVFFYEVFLLNNKFILIHDSTKIVYLKNNIINPLCILNNVDFNVVNISIVD